jgi:DNA-binding NarL/FixJ family response regulator
MAHFRTLIVEDHKDYCCFLQVTLQEKIQCQVIGHASDGLEAVRQAEEFQPDLILVDVGLPKLNGIEAARQIRKVAPNSKILFVSQNSSIEIVEAALQAGALGYLLKSDGAELPIAVETVLQGKQFLSASLAGRSSSSHVNVPATANTHSHEVEFYADDASLIEGYACFIESVLKSGNAVIVAVTDSHRASLLPRLDADGVDVAAAIEQGSYIPLDAVDAMSRLTVNGMPDSVRCREMIGDLVMGAVNGVKGNHGRVAVCGEIAPALLSKGNVEGAIKLEHLWDEITRSYGVHTLCGYLSSAFRDKESSQVFERMCAEHSAVHGREQCQ